MPHSSPRPRTARLRCAMSRGRRGRNSASSTRNYRNGFIKQYVRDHLILRTEAATNNVTDYGVNKAVEHLPALRDKLSAIEDSYLDIQKAILETFVDRGHLQRLARPSVTASGNRIRGV